MTPLDDAAIARHLARRGAAIASAPVAFDLARQARSIAALSQARGRRQPSWPRLVFGGAAAAASIVGIVVFAGAVSRVSPSPTAGTSASATVVAASDGSPGPSAALASGRPPVPAWSSIAWANGSSEPFRFDASTFVTDAIANGDGFVAVGYSQIEDADVGRIWTSADGRSWTELPGEPLDGLAEPRIFRIGGQLVILAQRRNATVGPALETRVSADGRTWREGPGLAPRFNARLSHREAGGPLGILLPTEGQLLALGPELTAWTTLPETGATTGAIRGGLIAAGRDRWFLVGATGSVAAGAPPTVGAIWTSADGASWQPAILHQPGGGVDQLVAVDGGYMAIGIPGGLPCDGCLGAIRLGRVAWFSSDGLVWDRVDVPALGPGGSVMTGVVDGDGRRVVAGALSYVQVVGGLGGAPRPDLAETLDGRTWTTIEGKGAPVQNGNIGVIGAHGIVVFGSSGNAGDGPIVPVPWFGSATEAP